MNKNIDSKKEYKNSALYRYIKLKESMKNKINNNSTITTLDILNVVEEINKSSVKILNKDLSIVLIRYESKKIYKLTQLLRRMTILYDMQNMHSSVFNY